MEYEPHTLLVLEVRTDDDTENDRNVITGSTRRQL